MRSNRDLPPNLYLVAGKYFQYRRPTDGKRFGMGTDKARAVTAAQQLNSMLAGLPGSDTVARVTRTGSEPFREFLKVYYGEILPKKDIAEKTRKIYGWQRPHIDRALGDLPLDTIDVREVSEFLSEFPARSSNQYRSTLIDIFRHAVARGLCRENVAELTIPQSERKARKRMTLELYQAIHAQAEPWLQNAMDLALLTLQRRGDIVAMKWENVRDGYLYVIQAKTKKHDTGYLRIRIGDDLDQVLKRCRDYVPSPFIIHRRPITQHKAQRDALEHWTQVRGDYLQKRLAAVRDALPGMSEMTVAERPTFHEIRSLGIKLYRESGIDPQRLAGHASEQMTKNYEAGYEEIRWVEVEANGIKPPCS